MVETTSQQQLEFIDDLQNLGLDKVGIELPQVCPPFLVNHYRLMPTLSQLVVVGDQSSGKSSVLQAITELPFPVKDGMCTRFPLEVVFKRTKPGSETVVNAIIRPGDQCAGDPALRETLCGFKRSYAELTSVIMEEIINEVHFQSSLTYQI